AIPRQTELIQLVTQIQNYISQPPPSENAKAQLDAFAEKAHAVYQQLLDPMLQQFPESIQRLMIIPDDFLSYIPYDLLLRNSLEKMNKTFTLEDTYLLQKYALSYHYSASFLLQQNPQSRASQRLVFAGFAPSFGETQKANKSRSVRVCTDDQLYSLSCNDQEVAAIQQLLKGDVFYRKQASKANFQAQSNQYQIIHLATHACVDEADPMLSKIYFTDDPLSNYDLYQLDLQADLAVLSACNTGSGKLVKGEGIMSLARAFLQAGCPSVLMSLWSVDDCATAEVMQHFYQQIIDGKSKDEALRQAKLNYLAAADRLHLHPYYWSAFVPFGDQQALQLAYGWGGKWPFLLGLTVVLLLLGWWRFGS
ncbi:MAG: CHAT domain-containing protein, partial [Bacteroidota bacterium]